MVIRVLDKMKNTWELRVIAWIGAGKFHDFDVVNFQFNVQTQVVWIKKKTETWITWTVMWAEWNNLKVGVFQRKTMRSLYRRKAGMSLLCINFVKEKIIRTITAPPPTPAPLALLLLPTQSKSPTWSWYVLKRTREVKWYFRGVCWTLYNVFM